MNWTSEWPKVEGEYYVREVKRKDRPPYRIIIDRSTAKYQESLNKGGREFLGPITPQLVERAAELEAIARDTLEVLDYDAGCSGDIADRIRKVLGE